MAAFGPAESRVSGAKATTITLRARTATPSQQVSLFVSSGLALENSEIQSKASQIRGRHKQTEESGDPSRTSIALIPSFIQPLGSLPPLRLHLHLEGRSGCFPPIKNYRIRQSILFPPIMSLSDSLFCAKVPS